MKRDDWTTPQKLFDFLNENFKFNVDAAASARNAKCEHFYGKRENFLSPASGPNNSARIWCNPPYSLSEHFASKLLIFYRLWNISSVILLPVRSDRIWYQQLLHTPNVRDVPITGRLHFGASGKGAFMYSILVIIGFKEVSFDYAYLDAGQFNTKGRGSATT